MQGGQTVPLNPVVPDGDHVGEFATVVVFVVQDVTRLAIGRVRPRFD
jgi:hypothetical protein